MTYEEHLKRLVMEVKEEIKQFSDNQIQDLYDWFHDELSVRMTKTWGHDDEQN